MITNWDLVSHIDTKTGNQRFSLLIDGTENDARLIAKKLAGFVKDPVPADAPFVYSFGLPDNLDETTQDKIRTATREGVELTNKVNQFVPGGVLGDPLFNGNYQKDGKDFPTFLMEQGTQAALNTQKKDSLDLDDAEQLTIKEISEEPSEPEPKSCTDLPEMVLPAHEEGTPTFTSYIPATHEEELSKKQHTFTADSLPEMVLPAHEADEPTFTSFIPATQIEGDVSSLFCKGTEENENEEKVSEEEEQQEHKEENPSSTSEFANLENPFQQQNTEKTAEAPLSQAEETCVPASIEEVFADPYETPLAGSPENSQQPIEEQPATEGAASPVKEEKNSQTPQIASKDTKEDSNTPSTDMAEDALPLDDKDMLIKDMEGTVLDRMPIDDIFAAETKYDMFVDVANKVQAQEIREKKLNEAIDSPEEENKIDIFSQNLKEQTSVIDLTALRTALDHLPAAATEPTSSHEKTDMQLEGQTVLLDGRDTPRVEIPAIVPPVEKVQTNNREDDDIALHTVRAAQPIDDTLPTITVRQKTSETNLNQQQPEEEEPVALPAAEKETDPSPSKETPIPQGTASETAVEPKTTKKLRRKKSMEEKKQKTQFRLKPKTPSAPTPVPPAPSAPKPQAPTSEKTVLPTPIAKSTPKPTITLRKKLPVAPETPTPTPGKTILEKTKTIDHSIQVSLSELKKHNWPLEVPLVPTYTLSNMVMSVNRFAHATAISVIESPGKLYNPLVLHGPTGTGKSHFLNAMAYAFSQKFGQANIFMTNGVRLSRGIQRYITEGNIEKFDQFMSTVKVLLIDDIHLLAINEQNRAYISKLLNTFLKEQRQIVITSKYPPESLEKLEELIKFRLDSGWISELKSPTGQVQFKITKKMLLENHVDLTDQQITDFFSAEHMTLGTVQRSVRRMKVLENLLPANLPPQQRSAAAILEKLLASQGEDQNSHILTVEPETVTSITSMGNGEWGRIGFFYPANCSDKMNWLVYSLQERAKELGIEGGPEIVVRSSYATENIISSAFKIANLCDNKKLKGAVILGPQRNACDLSVRENFYDILTHMLEVMLIRCGIINFESIRQPSMYVKVLAELMR